HPGPPAAGALVMRRESWVVTRIAVLMILVLVGAATVPWPVRPGSLDQSRRMLESAVMALQLGGALAFLWSKLDPVGGREAWAVVGTQIGLGSMGAVCARLDSCFALFAGATLVALLLRTILGADVTFTEGLGRRPGASRSNGGSGKVFS